MKYADVNQFSPINEIRSMSWMRLWANTHAAKTTTTTIATTNKNHNTNKTKNNFDFRFYSTANRRRVQLRRRIKVHRNPVVNRALIVRNPNRHHRRRHRWNDRAQKSEAHDRRVVRRTRNQKVEKTTSHLVSVQPTGIQKFKPLFAFPLPHITYTQHSYHFTPSTVFKPNSIAPTANTVRYKLGFFKLFPIIVNSEIPFPHSPVDAIYHVDKYPIHHIHSQT